MLQKKKNLTVASQFTKEFVFDVEKVKLGKKSALNLFSFWLRRNKVFFFSSSALYKFLRFLFRKGGAGGGGGETKHLIYLSISNL